MIADVWTVMRKEWQEYLNQGSSRFGTFAGVFVTIAFLGVAWPLFLGREWVRGTSGVGTGLATVFVVAPLVADAIAGERERRTLETLLASRLPDRAILFGKVGAAVAVGWSLTLVTRLLGLIAVNLVVDPPIVPGGDWWASTALILAACVYLAGIGALVSLRAPTVKQATQGAMIAAFLPFLLLVVLGLLGLLALSALPDAVTDPVEDLLGAGGGISPAIVGAAAVALLALTPLLLAMRRFERTRLLLD